MRRGFTPDRDGTRRGAPLYAGERDRVSSGSSFQYSFGLLPAERRRAVESVYAFCRAIDDVADEEPLDSDRAARALGRYREEVSRCYGGAPTLAVTRNLQSVIRE